MKRTFLPAPPLPAGRPLLVITGFMGTGKTATGRRAAEILGMPFVDLDETVAVRARMPASELIVRCGEQAFRHLEREAIRDAARLSGAVVTTGGGAPLQADSFGALTDGACVAVLSCTPGQLLQRLRAGQARPLLSPEPAAEIEQLLQERARPYAEAGANAAVRVPIDTSDLPVERVAQEVAAVYRTVAPPGDPTRVRVAVNECPYTVRVGTGVIEDLGASVADVIPEARAAVVVFDPAVGADVMGRVSSSLRRGGLRVREVGVPSGEPSKSIQVAASLWNSFREALVESTDLIVAVGGGATLDTAGFAAATYARGVNLVNVPTTLLAMVDAALGGKVGIDHVGVKNLIGSFHQPRLVAADSTTLASLPARTLRAGLAELIKGAALASPLVLDILESTTSLPDGDHSAWLEWLVEQSVRIKAGYIAEDPRDQGLRHALNLGHTFAHGLEAASRYQVPHGEAVSIGLVAAARLGVEVGSTPAQLLDRLRALLSRVGLPTEPPPGLESEAILEAMTADKKRRSGRATFVTPAPGGAELVEDVPLKFALSALLGELPERVRA